MHVHFLLTDSFNSAAAEARVRDFSMHRVMPYSTLIHQLRKELRQPCKCATSLRTFCIGWVSVSHLSDRKKEFFCRRIAGGPLIHTNTSFRFFFISLLVTWKVVRQTGGMSKPIARQPPDTLFNSFLLYEFFYKLQNFTVPRLQVKNENWVTGMRELPVSHFFVGRAGTKCVMDYATHCEHVSRFVKRFF